MKKFVFGLLLTLFSANAFADANSCGTPSDLPKVKGVVRQIDTANGRLKLKHDEIPNLSMPPMTMFFKAGADCMLELSAGDKVLFTADESNGALTVLWIEKRANND